MCHMFRNFESIMSFEDTMTEPELPSSLDISSLVLSASQSEIVDSLAWASQIVPTTVLYTILLAFLVFL